MPRKLIYLFCLLAPIALFGQQTHPILPIGSSAPNFELPGVDGKIHKLTDYADKPVLAVVFTCNHCPIAQMYERRIEQLYEDYGKRGVAVVAIQGNDPKAIRIDELDSSDVSDTLDDMRIRVQYKHLQFPYLYGGDTQEVTRAFGPQATPHIFIFDKERRLRYEGRIDNSYRTEQVKTNDARDAIEAVLAGREVAVKHTGVFGCSTKWSEKSAQREEAERKIEAQPVHVEKVDAAGLKTLRANPSHHVTLISFWATWCGSCVAEFADLQDTYRMYNSRDFDLVTVSANMPDEEPGVLRLLQKKHATSRNLLFSSDDTEKLQAAFDTEWQSAVPYTVVLDPEGKIIYKTLGTVDLLEMRRKILAAMPSDYIGFNRYWSAN
ncbi:redoxin domain-containing protein [Edaphobacter modestus]|uniref:Peroxiredoxin n=1 Tax=Edaphobacter modestus TaxID=388466 RepID=A0A4V2G4Q5_9BACT|nr:redoxin domain-containing protein [Edaphobacter modestus]RZU41906.1 peroxiredoxin [Edaphobacter modestus]